MVKQYPVDAVCLEEEDGGGGGAADEEGGDGEGFERHEARITCVPSGEGTHTQTHLSSGGHTPPQLDPSLTVVATACDFLHLHLLFRFSGSQFTLLNHQQGLLLSLWQRGTSTELGIFHHQQNGY